MDELGRQSLFSRLRKARSHTDLLDIEQRRAGEHSALIAGLDGQRGQRYRIVSWQGCLPACTELLQEAVQSLSR
jgi:hypothetical protein